MGRGKFIHIFENLLFNSGDLKSSAFSAAIEWLVNASFDIALKSSLKSYAGDLWTVYYEKAINRTLEKVPIEELFLI